MLQRIIVSILALSILALVAATAPADKEAFDGAMETASSQLRTMRRTKFDPKSQQQNLEALQKLESALLVAKANIDAIEAVALENQTGWIITTDKSHVDLLLTRINDAT